MYTTVHMLCQRHTWYSWLDYMQTATCNSLKYEQVSTKPW
jgi:hypothetical protein